jgi:hypothetical protein
MNAPNRDALMFSMGFNGYQRIYARNVATQRAYCERHGMAYEFLSRPFFTPLLMECCWLKVPLIIAALDRGWPWVAYIDCDVEVREVCPDLRTLEQPGKALYMASGYSGRLNSGVIIVKNTPEVRELFQRILDGAQKRLPPEDDVGWGENGHIIHFAKNSPLLATIPRQWNNNHDPALADFMRHYSAGPMRPLYAPRAHERAWALLGKAYLKSSRWRSAPGSGEARFFDNLAALQAQATRGRAAFSL